MDEKKSSKKVSGRRPSAPPKFFRIFFSGLGPRLRQENKNILIHVVDISKKT